MTKLKTHRPVLECPAWCDGHPKPDLPDYLVHESVHTGFNTVATWIEADDNTREGEREQVRIRIDAREGFGPATARNLAAWLVELADDLESDPDFQSTERDIDREWDREIRPAVPALWWDTNANWDIELPALEYRGNPVSGIRKARAQYGQGK